MVKHNNVVPNVHFKKWWQRYVRTWLDQPMKKKTRVMKRQEKAKQIWPRPVGGLLRPAVHPPTQRYNMKLRAGRGFTLEELKEAGIAAKQARTIGIAVDHRRRNKCTESLQLNANRLKLYKSKLVLFPRGSKAKQGDTARSELSNVTQNTHKDIIPLPKIALREKATAITAEMTDAKKTAFAQIRDARLKKKQLGKMLKKQAESKE